jgi:hypothetical protein
VWVRAAPLKRNVMSFPNPLRSIVKIIVSLFTVLVAATVCFACDCKTLLPPDSFKAADLVFVGNVISSDKSESEVNSSFRVEQVLKGTNNGQVVITGHNSDCDYSFQTGNAYIVYAHQSNGKFFASTCMSTKAVYAPAQPTFIRYTSPPRYGYRAFVAGVVLLVALGVGYLVGRVWPRAT